MIQENLISTTDICVHYNVEFSFINSLYQSGLIEIRTIESAAFIPAEQLEKLEKIVRLHHELEINLEGIEAISHLLERVISLQDENLILKNRLRIYEGE